ncbi:MAG: lysophospholipid acyltransferase family protein, partial [Halioglobus sp.]|nr:lysophospholipid acyltransferase family protein [Halioglobus sp.]
AAHKIEGVFFRSIFWLIRRLSLQSALKLSGTLFAALGRNSDKAQKARTNLEIAFPGRPEQWYRDTIREIFRHLGYSAVELIKLDQIWREREQRLEYRLEPGAQAHVNTGGATMFITAHVGPWQVAPLLAREHGFTINTIYAPESHPIMNELMQDLRGAIGDRLISSEAGPRPIIKELKAGNSIVLAMDTRPDAGKLVPFFGRDALTNTSAVGLALRTGAAILLGRGERLPGGRYRLTLYDPITSPNPDADIKEQSSAITEIIHGHFEQWIRETPEQWICLKRRWPKEGRL